MTRIFQSVSIPRRTNFEAFADWIESTKPGVLTSVKAFMDTFPVKKWNQYELEELAEGRLVPRDEEYEATLGADDRRFARKKIAERIAAGTNYWAVLA